MSDSGDSGAPEVDDFAGAPDAARRQFDAYRQRTRETDYAERLRTALAEYQSVESFDVGDLVQWKRYMRIRPYPLNGAPAIVVARANGHDQGSPVEGDDEVDDIVLGFLDGDDQFHMFPFPSARFTRYLD